MTTIAVNEKNIQKCMFIMNALENGWKVKKRKGSYIFTKKHNDRKEIFKTGYLESFFMENMR